ncbi:MAG: glycosyltransferase family 4 protein [Bacteroidales bacterium]|nr:glycosyltransferase family 4 protein [Bacteroidales bacterium]
MNGDKLKVAWVCWVSNPEIRENLTFSNNIIDKVLRKIMHKPRRLDDYSQWITNAINEFKNIDDIEVHIISIHSHINKKVIEFQKDGIFYHFFKSEDDLTVLGKYVNKITGKYVSSDYDKNRKVVNEILAKIKPDVIHLYGAESPQYAAFALDVDVDKTPLLVGLQTMMSDPKFKENYPISEESYASRAGMEKQILTHVRYLSSTIKSFREIVWHYVNPNAIFFNTDLIFGEKPHLEKCEKSFDFVYFSLNINKAADLAIEAFAIAKKSHPEIKLLVIGDYDEDFKRQLDARIAELDIAENIVITGKLQTHDDVINAVKKARFALLPLKIDFIAGTIREAIACGLPVVTTITSGTPTLNEKRESVLLSPVGDHEALAANMVWLLESEELANTLVANALETSDELYGNKGMALKLREVYKALYAKYAYGTEIPQEFYTLNTER